MDWNKLKFTKLEQGILDFLFRNPTTSFNGKELAKSLNVSQTAISKASRRLVKLELIKLDKKIQLSIKLNRENKKTFILKRITNLKELYVSGLISILEKKFPGVTIILFGSYSYGEDTEESDIDIAIIGYKEKNIDLVQIEKYFQKELRLHFFKDFNSIPKNLKENIFNGITLKGAIKL